MRLNLTGSLDLGIVECFGRIRRGMGVFCTRRLNLRRAVFRFLLGVMGIFQLGVRPEVGGGKGGGMNEPVGWRGLAVLLGLHRSD